MRKGLRNRQPGKWPATKTKLTQREIASMGGKAPHKGPRGFAAMFPERRRAVAAQGERSQQQETTAP